MSNSALSAKVHAMRGKFLTDKDYDSLMNMKSVPAVAAYLIENTSYKDAFHGVLPMELHRGRVEQLLREHLRSDLKRMTPFMNRGSKRFSELIEIGEGIEKIKVCLRLIGIHHPESISEYVFQLSEGKGGISGATTEAESIDDFIELLRNTPYWAALAHFKGRPERQRLFYMETALDAYFAGLVTKYAKKYLSEQEAKSVIKLYGTEFDLENLTFLLRCKKNFNMPKDEIYASIIPSYYKVKKETIAHIVDSPSYSDAIAVIKSETPYGRAFSEADRFIEKRQSEYFSRVLNRAARINSYSVEASICYINLRRIETNNIVSVIEGIRYGIYPEQIKTYLIGYGRGGEEI